MAQILKFPTKRIEPVTVRNGRKHRVTVKILDQVRPRRTRWIVQFEIQESAGRDALLGFKDAAVARGYQHRFIIGRTRLLRQFVAETADLVAAGKVAIWVDGTQVQPRIKRSA